MHTLVEVKYRKFPLVFGQRLAETPAFAPWKQAGWYITWRHSTIVEGSIFVETLLKRPADGHSIES